MGICDCLIVLEKIPQLSLLAVLLFLYSFFRNGWCFIVFQKLNPLNIRSCNVFSFCTSTCDSCGWTQKYHGWHFRWLPFSFFLSKFPANTIWFLNKFKLTSCLFINIIFCNFHFVDSFLLILGDDLAYAIFWKEFEIFVLRLVSVFADEMINQPDGFSQGSIEIIFDTTIFFTR